MRTNQSSWDEMFFGIALMVGSRSKDDNTQNGACIVTDDHLLIGTGYNGFIRDIADTEERWQKPLKYRYVVHAERNAIANCILPAQIKGSTLYIWSSRHYLPCAECAKEISHRGIRLVKVAGMPEMSETYHWDETKDIFDIVGVKVELVPFVETNFWQSRIVPIIQNNPQTV